MGTVWLVGSAGCEHYHVMFVCATEKQARKRFEQVKSGEVRSVKRSLSHAEKEGRRRDDWYYEYYENLKNSSFDHQYTSIHDHPFAHERDLEE